MMGVELDNSSPASHAMTQRRQQGHSYHSSGGHLSGERERERRFLAGDYIALGLQSLRIIFTLILQ